MQSSAARKERFLILPKRRGPRRRFVRKRPSQIWLVRISLIVFPEGALKHNTGLIGFRTGAFQAAAQAGIPVIPVALRGVRSCCATKCAPKSSGTAASRTLPPALPSARSQRRQAHPSSPISADGAPCDFWNTTR